MARHGLFLGWRLLFSALLTIELPGDVDAGWFGLQRCVPVAPHLVQLVSHFTRILPDICDLSDIVHWIVVPMPLTRFRRQD